MPTSPTMMLTTRQLPAGNTDRPAPASAAATLAPFAGDRVVRGAERAMALDRIARAGEHGNAPSRGSDSRAASAQHVDPQRRDALLAELLSQVPRGDRHAAQTAIPAILDAARRNGSTDPNRIGYLLATAQTESDFGAHMTEAGHTKAWYNAAYGCEDGNRPGTSDGFDYRGRGYVQTTRAGRYAELSRQLGLPDVAVQRGAHSSAEPALVAHPERLTEPKLAAEALVVGVERNLFTHNASAALDTTIPVGRKPGDVDFYHARGIVNGIVHDQAQAIARHATTYAQILDRFRHSVLGAPAAR